QNPATAVKRTRIQIAFHTHPQAAHAAAASELAHQLLDSLKAYLVAQQEPASSTPLSN
ncbi:MAG: hypothetical protein JNG90_14515, partial [Planctomycetaceae bacterium]|nr:hypothetical protein [Planctomycetaceae bacterium]